jgi:hypothetical protein
MLATNDPDKFWNRFKRVGEEDNPKISLDRVHVTLDR